MNAELKDKLENIKNNSAFKRFIKLLYEVFELDKGDLDFGIYKILNARRDKIIEFLNGTGSYEEKGLPQQIIEALDLVSCGDKESIENEIDELIKKLKELGSSDEQINDNVKIKELKAKLNNGTDLTSLQIEIYNNLYEFFSRYYDEGDFISKRRYKKDVYAIPYNGEEVKLTWANEDQYYIKTASNFNNYAFKVKDIEENEWKINFRVVNATVEKNNNKENKKRIFMLYDKNIDENEDKHETIIIDKIKREIVINFIYDYPQAGYKDDVTKEGASKVNSGNYEKNKCYIGILNTLANDKSIESISTKLFRKDIVSGKKTIDLLGKNIIKFFAKNQFDFFIHKNLREFLNRELDFYIKAEIMNLDNIEDATNEIDLNKYLVKIKVIKKIARVIIDFLAEIEDFQKKMYLKKKFVVDTNYIITMDYIVGNNELMNEVLKNEKQLKEWEEYYNLKEILHNIDLKNEEHLNSIKYLLLDTKNFNYDFKEKLLNCIGGLEAKTNGLLFNADNFQALRILRNKFMQQIDSIYIDPPYNAPKSEVLYKNSFKDSAWLTMIFTRLNESNCLKKLEGSYCIAIDKYEQNKLHTMCQNMFVDDDIVSVAIEHNKKGTQGDHFSYSNEFAVFIIPMKKKKINSIPIDKDKWEYSNFRNWGGESERTDAANCFYPLYVKNGSIIGIDKIADDTFHPVSNNILINDEIQILDPITNKYMKYISSKDNPIYQIWPVDGQGIERKWRYAIQSILDIYKYLIVKEGDEGIEIKMPKMSENYKTLWSDSKYNAGDYGTKILTSLGFSQKDFEYPKSIYTVHDCIYAVSSHNSIVLDYFAGSGTTGQVVIDLNRGDGGNRKYILVEMGDYFDTVLVPRIKKVIYCNDWKEGKPRNRNTGVSQIVKYQTIESYEDTLNNIDVNSLDTLLNPDNIKYSLDLKNEDILQNKVFEKPFEYKMNIQIDNEIKNVTIDLVETFNYLIGLYVDRSFITKEIDGLKHKLIVGSLRTGEKTAVIWRDIDKNEYNSNKTINKFVNENLEYLIDVENIYINGDASLDIFEFEGKEIDLNRNKLITEEKFKKEMFSYEDF